MKSLGMKKEQFMDKVAELASHNEVLFKGCSQAIVAAFQEILDLKDLLALRAASSFAGGIARQGATCGALIGGAMIINMKYGRDNLEDYDTFQRGFEPVVRLCSMFREEFGSLDCRDITHVDMLNPEEMKSFYSSGRHDRECAIVVGKTARMVASVLFDVEQKLFFDLSKLR